MVNKTQLLRRLLVLGCLLLLCVGLAGGQLLQLQLINGESYVRRSASFLTTTSTVSAARGEILDRYGRAMVTNQTGFSLVLIYSSFWEDKEDRFEVLLDLANRVKADGTAAAAANTDGGDETGDGTETDTDTTEETSAAVLNDVMPITDTAPYEYVGAEGDSERKALSDYIKQSADTLGLKAVQDAKAAANTANEENPQYDADGNKIDQVSQIDATTLVSASEFISAMRTYMENNLGMQTGLSDADARTLVGLYYSMRRVGFNNNATFTLADNVSMDLIAYIKEHHQQYTGVDVQSEAIRKYDTTYAAHLLGTVGPMFTEEWTGTKNGGPYQNKAGYTMNDTIGKSGLESALESYLHGTAGSRTVETDLGGDSITDHANSYAPQPGDNVITTIDLELQEVAEQSLANYLSGYERGGAAVALDPDTGEVLVMASYPTYNLENYNKDYDQISSDSRSPELNRATLGLYPPGSTFKVLTAIAALEEGIIDANTTYVCDGKFEYGGVTFPCNNHEQPMTLDVTQAIKYSCNVFFYNVGQQLTGAHLENWCDKFGLGNVTGVEIAEYAGQAAGPTEREANRKNDPTLREWQGGDDVNAAIGQSDNLFTPLQLANYMAAVVNGGTLYQPTLVKSIKTYDYSDVVEEEQPKVIDTIEFSDATRDLVMKGMSEVTAEGGTAATTFADYPIKVGGKTGSAEMTERKDGVETNYTNGLFVAFAPFDDPEIVVCVVGEGAGHGSAVAPIVRDILDAYFAEEEPDTVESVQSENTMVP
ncbi:penicillin-binding transpeptidase domain-containing protein [Agathobaculum sp. Marseille-P7918]|uniref:penicillin-binding transpeptidase domain-containing protein n=1 Tax=Agathobaculum sp. Marseille-P7918 TaxID=2479843 RepID=UPI00356AB910